MRRELARELTANGLAAYYATLPEVGIREPTTPRKWAAQNRRIGQGGSPLSMHGDIPFDESVMPWVGEPMDAAVDPEVSHLVLWWGSGTGKTDGVVSNLIGWAIHESPRNIMVLYPDEKARDKWSRDVLERTIQATPVLRSRVVEKKGRESGNTIAYKAFPGGSLYATAAGSPSNLRGPRVGLAYAGEVDAMPDDVGGSIDKPGEGDPLRLLFRRCEGFADSIKVVEGTGTIDGLSRIQSWYLRTDQRKWFVGCRKCGEPFVIMWQHIRFPKGPEHAYLECPNPACGAIHTDAQRIRISRDGEWRPTAPFSGMRGYWLNAFVSTLPPEKGYRTKMHQWAKEFSDARHSDKPRLALRTIINTVWAECDSPGQSAEAKTEWEPLFARREPYAVDKLKPVILPEPVRVITGSGDVQGNRVEVFFYGWGQDEQCWVLEKAIIHGNPETKKLWDDVEKVILRRFTHASGAQLEASIGFFDRGRYTDFVDQFAIRPALAGRVYTVKGENVPGMPVIGRIRKAGRGNTYFRIGTDAAKDYIFGKLSLPWPEDGRSFPPGFIHFPQSLEAHVFKQIVSERAKTIYDRGKQYRKYGFWDDNGKPLPKESNEALDCFVYGFAAFRLQRWDFAAIEASLSESGKKAPVRRVAEDEEDDYVTGWRRH